MSELRWTNSGTRMCSMFASEPVSRLSTQITRWPRRSSSSQRCEPRNPAPPVTREVGIGGNLAWPPVAALGDRYSLSRPPREGNSYEEDNRGDGRIRSGSAGGFRGERDGQCDPLRGK